MYQRMASTDLDQAFQALANGTRRGIIEQLSRSEASVATLAASYDIAQPTFLRHIRVLEAAGLVSTQKEGRVRTCRLESERLARLESWLHRYQRGWASRLDRLADLVDAPHTPQEPPDEP